MLLPRLGKIQLHIMQLLWARGLLTAREITLALNESNPLSRSTVQTLLRKLEKKGAVSHTIRDHTFYFQALVEPDTVRVPAVKGFIDRVFEGSASSLISYLLKNERISGEELDQIRNLIHEAREEKKREQQP
jgi:predicted transcriptional regulator